MIQQSLQPECPSTGEWIKICGADITLEYYTENNAICSNLEDATRDYYTKWSKLERKTDTM